MPPPTCNEASQQGSVKRFMLASFRPVDPEVSVRIEALLNMNEVPSESTRLVGPIARLRFLPRRAPSSPPGIDRDERKAGATDASTNPIAPHRRLPELACGLGPAACSSFALQISVEPDEIHGASGDPQRLEIIRRHACPA
jgi:hypothetical protein